MSANDGISVTKCTEAVDEPCGLRRVLEVALEFRSGRGDRDDVVGANLLEEERAVRDADPRLLDHPVSAPVVDTEHDGEQHDVDGDPRRSGSAAGGSVSRSPVQHAIQIGSPRASTAVRLESRFKAEMQEMLESAMLIGLGAVAVWTYVNCPRLRPGSLIRAVAHVIVSFAGFALLPALLSVVLPLLPARDIAALRRVGAPDSGAHVPVAQLGVVDRPDPARDRRQAARWAPGLRQVLGPMLALLGR